MSTVKTITIDQLKPGMFVVWMDQSWYRTPFFSHKRLIRHQEDIDLLQQHGVKELKIDTEKSLDSETDSPGKDPQPGAATKQVPPPPPIRKRKATTPLRAREQAAAAHTTYTEATSSVERMFEWVETGTVSPPEEVQEVVGNMLSQVLEDRTSMLSLLQVQKMQRFDRSLASHALDVCALSLIVAQAYGVPEGEMEALGAGALLHDIGYIWLPRNLYRKNLELTEQEAAVMHQHPTLGLAILRETNEERETVLRIVGEHQEYGDGSGFPHKLKGDTISRLAQLVGLVDVYDGMISRRVGRPAMLPHDAVRQLFHLGETGQFPKELVEAMIKSLGVYPIGSLVLLNTKEQAVVVAVNPTQRLKPIVKVITGPHGKSYLPPLRINLAHQSAGTSPRAIDKVLDPLHERVNVALFLDGIDPETT